MPTLQIRQLPEDIYHTLAFRAEKAHRSLAQQAVIELRKLPELEISQKRQQVLIDIEQELQQRSRSHKKLSRTPESLQREDRDL